MTDHIERINALTTNARNTWFALLGALIFVGVTLMQVEPIDFYGVNRATDLPLVNVAVPTRLFFYAAPFLVAAIYGYFHLYLIRLWDALGEAPAQDDEGRPLSICIQPWLVSDAALHLRRFLRDEPCAPKRVLEWPSAVLNFALAWAFGPIALGYMWLQSLPARTFWLTMIVTMALALCLMVGTASFKLLVARMAPKDRWQPHVWTSSLMMITALIVGFGFLPLTVDRTASFALNPATLILTGERIVERPKDWLPPQIAERYAHKKWCDREGKDYAALTEKDEQEFQAEWEILRRNTISDLKKPEFNPLRQDELDQLVLSALGIDEWDLADFTKSKTFDQINASVAPQARKAPDFRNGDLRDVFLAGSNLVAARLQNARMQGANLERAQLSYANLTGGTDLSQAILVGANLRWARMEGADLFEAQMERADLSGAQMERANLRWAQMEGADLIEAQMERADLSLSLLTATPPVSDPLFLTSLRASKNDGGALREIDLTTARFDTATDWRNVFLDSSVQVPPYLRQRMNAPCQWVWAETYRADSGPLSDQEFFGLWRGWVERRIGPRGIWQRIAPKGWENVSAIPLPADCWWQMGPLRRDHGGGR